MAVKRGQKRAAANVTVFKSLEHKYCGVETKGMIASRYQMILDPARFDSKRKLSGRG